MEDEALVVVGLDGFSEADVHQLRAIELDVGDRLDHEDAVVDLLATQDGMQVVQESAQVLLAIPVGDDERHARSRLAFAGTEATSWSDQREHVVQLIHGRRL